MLYITYPCCDVTKPLLPDNELGIVSVHHCRIHDQGYDWSDRRTDDQIIEDTETRWFQCPLY